VSAAVSAHWQLPAWETVTPSLWAPQVPSSYAVPLQPHTTPSNGRGVHASPIGTQVPAAAPQLVGMHATTFA